jgi:hypothetical protein
MYSCYRNLCTSKITWNCNNKKSCSSPVAFAVFMENNNDRESNSRISFDISTSQWKWRQIQPSSSSTCPSPRHLHSLVSHKNYLYLFGGFGDGEKYLDDFWQFSVGNFNLFPFCRFDFTFVFCVIHYYIYLMLFMYYIISKASLDENKIEKSSISASFSPSRCSSRKNGDIYISLLILLLMTATLNRTK